jgi:DNA-directed RNA polymerase specialized sigma24 family protein
MPSVAFLPTPKDLLVRIVEGRCGEGREKASSDEWRRDLGLLCAYYQEVIVHWFRIRGLSVQDAEDLSGDFMNRWLAGDPLANYVPGPVPFRRFLARSLGNFLREHIERRNTQKRGGLLEEVTGAIHSIPADPAPWLPADDIAIARSIYGRALKTVREKFAAEGHWELLVSVAVELTPQTSMNTYHDLSNQTGLSVGAIRVRVHRLRGAFWGAFESEVRRMCGPGVSTEEELAAVVEALFHSVRNPT